MTEGQQANQHTGGSPSNGRRGEIIAAAGRAFARRGYHAATVKDIVREAGIAPGTLYLYFDSKRDLLAGFLDEVIGAAEARMDDLAGLPLEQALATFLRERLEVMSANRDLVKVILSEALYDEELRERVEQYVGRRVRRMIVRFLREHGAGALSRARLQHIAQALQAQVVFYGVLGPALMPSQVCRPDRDAREIAALMVHGIGGLLKEGR